MKLLNEMETEFIILVLDNYVRSGLITKMCINLSTVINFDYYKPDEMP